MPRSFQRRFGLSTDTVSSEETCRVYVNASPIDVPRSSTVLDALEMVDASLADAVRSGSSVVTDSRGLPILPDTPVFGGAILRVVAARKRDT